MDESLRSDVEAFRREDPDPDTQQELDALRSQPDELRARFSGPLTFGTAGLRGLIGAGPSRMNRVGVLKTTFALATALKNAGLSGKPVVVGYDAREKGRLFAEDAARVFHGLGFAVHLFDEPVPTPLVAFAVRFLHAACGVVVTASHNPKGYSGYKVYGATGAQILPPFDEEVERLRAQSPPANTLASWDLSGADAGLYGRVSHAYLDAVLPLVRRKGTFARDFPVVYTPLHGVGGKLVHGLCARLGYDHVFAVPEQSAPDGSFPTTPKPNPEEKGSLDLAIRCADAHGADLIVANDPDADRLAVAVRTPQGFVGLTGNEVGILLGHALLENAPKNALAITTIVSSPLFERMARALGARVELTLTGFKWICGKALELEREGMHFVFGYEEALGYAVGSVVRDKDGVSALGFVLELAASLRERGETLRDELSRIDRKFGLSASEQVSREVKGEEGRLSMQAALARLRKAPPSKVGTFRVDAVNDYLLGEGLPASDVVALSLSDGARHARIVVRPSGTEPKMKLYFDVLEPVPPEEELLAAKGRAERALSHLRDSFLGILGDGNP